MKRILSILFMCIFVVLSPTRASAACTSSQIDVLGDGTQCETSKFELTTTSLAANDTFIFSLSAIGTFYVDWGDGSAIETITRSDTTATDYSHTYTTAGAKTIRFGGIATEYSSYNFAGAIYTDPAISFYKETGGTQDKIASISGNLSAMFPYLGSGNVQSPRFYETFRGATNLTSVPATLFADYTVGRGNMFRYTFYGCTGLTSLPAGLFSSFTTGEDSMFLYTFSGCTGLTSVPAGLFSGITTGAESMFYGTFENCTGLTSIPAGLFGGITSSGKDMFQNTFSGCTGLTSIPGGLFGGKTSTYYGEFSGTFKDCTGLTSIPSELFSNISMNNSQPYVFQDTFRGCTGLTSIPAGLFRSITSSGTQLFNGTFADCTNLAGYIPPDTFEGLIENGSPTGSGMWGAFSNTKLATSCPTGTQQYITGYESSWGGKVSCTCAAGYWIEGNTCTACSNTIPAHSSYALGATNATCPWVCDAGYVSNGTSCVSPTFSATTTSLNANDTFTFSLSAIGTFYVNYGDGTQRTIVRTNTTSTSYSHKYKSAGTYTINFGGTATGYNTSSSTAAISFYNNTKIASLSGNLSAMFPQLGYSSGQYPVFYQTFRGATNLTSVPATLFADYTSGRSYMFRYTFYGCTGLTSVPAGLFSGITTSAQYMFSQTFYGCTNLGGYIPPDTFAGLIANGSPTASNMWSSTFANTQLLTECPTGTEQYITRYEGSTDGTTWNGKVSCGCEAGYWVDGSTCTACSNTIPAHSSYTTGATNATCPWVCDSGYVSNGTSCVDSAFSVTTTSLSANDTFTFSLSAVGTFYVNWGDGTQQTIVRDNTTSTWYTHTYSSAGTYTIGFGGTATGYSTSTTEAAISFYKSSGGSQGKIASISGNLGSIFPYLGSDASQAPKFYQTFRGATNLTSIPANLFSGITTGGQYMFSYTFYGCTGLTSIPAELFSGITTGANYMFRYTFGGCTGLTSIPAGLFSGITTGATSMFYYTFSGCTGLTSIPAGLFSGITTAAGGMFYNTFNGCTGLTSIPAGLFSGITTGADSMFYGTFYGCTGLTTVPEGLFSGITTAASYMFRETFYGCTGLTSIPTLFGNISGGANYMFDGTFELCTNLATIPETLFSGITTGATYMFERTFSGCSSLQVLPSFANITTGVANTFYYTFYSCPNLSGYIPPTMFAGLIAAGAPANTFYSTFQNSYTLVSVCPAGTTQYVTGFEGAGTWNSRVSCQPCPAGTYKDVAGNEACSACGVGTYMSGTGATECDACTNTKPANSSYSGPGGTTNSCPWACDAGMFETGTSCVEPVFSVTTTQLSANDTFIFSLSAKGTFYVDWGDGSAIETITRSRTWSTEYSHTYATAGSYTIRFGSDNVTAYNGGNTGSSTAAISFYKSSGGTQSKIASVSGSLGALLPQLGTADGQYPRFVDTFRDATNMTSVSGTLFSGLTGGTYMFNRTFYGCTGLTGVPATLFSGITTGATDMFNYTFSGCTGLTSLPATLFSGITTGATEMFHRTFYGCTGLTSLPATLFSGIITGAEFLFHQTFSGCTGLTTIPGTLFSGITAGVYEMFAWTFSGCTGLTSIPGNLFGNLTTVADRMFEHTFDGCSGLTSIPENLFSSVTTGAVSLFYQTFAECTGLTSIPATLFGNITTGAQHMFDGTFYHCSGLTSIPATLFSSITTFGDHMFGSTFSGCTSLTTIPATLFSNVTTPTTGLFHYTFYGCTGLTSIPAGLFSGVTGSAEDLFEYTFYGCSNLTSIPAGLFNGITSGAISMFYYTFSNTGLTSLPDGLFANITTGANYMFQSTFGYCRNLSGYVPPTMFAGLIANNSPYSTDMMKTIFNNTALDTACPAGTTQYITNYESYWNSKVSCEPCAAGTYKDVVGNGACSACATGTYSSTTGAAACTGCPELDTGYAYVDGTGWTSYGQCSEQMRPTNCYSGYLTKTASSASAWGTAVSTLSAEPGYEVTGSGDNTVCSECGVGRYGPGGTTACSSCPTGLTTVGYGSGADEAADCGHKFHAGDGVLYLRSVKKTTPSLNVRIGNDVFYGNMSTEQMNMSGSCEDNPELKVNNGGTIYWVHDDSSHFCGVPM